LQIPRPIRPQIRLQPRQPGKRTSEIQSETELEVEGRLNFKVGDKDILQPAAEKVIEGEPAPLVSDKVDRHRSEQSAGIALVLDRSFKEQKRAARLKRRQKIRVRRLAIEERTDLQLQLGIVRVLIRGQVEAVPYT